MQQERLIGEHNDQIETNPLHTSTPIKKSYHKYVQSKYKEQQQTNDVQHCLNHDTKVQPNQVKIQTNITEIKIESSKKTKEKKNDSQPPLKQNKNPKQNIKEITKQIVGDRQLNPQQREQQQQLIKVKEMLEGKVFIVWIFVSTQKLPQQIQGRIRMMYSGVQHNDKKLVIPICRFGWQFRPFLQLQKCYFKIVTDLDNAEQLLKLRPTERIVEYYIYNNQGQSGFRKAIEFKSLTKKVKGIIEDYQQVVNRAQQEVQNEIDIYFENNALAKHSIAQKQNNIFSKKQTLIMKSKENRKENRKFPSFLRLIGEQNTKGILYRSNLYGALKISVKEKQQYYKQFVNLVKQQYQSEEDKQNLEQYSEIQHFTNQHTIDIAKAVIGFYIKQSFYYKILNSMLRTLKTTSQFKHCVLPFNETYHSVRMLYKQQIKCSQDGRTLSSKTYFRGAKLRKRDFEYLKKGVFIEMFGFVSTSINLDRAKEHTDQDYYIFEIKIPSITIPKQFDKYDHGFVDINQFGLSSKINDQEILFNAMNIYRVSAVGQKQYQNIGAIYNISLIKL